MYLSGCNKRQKGLGERLMFVCGIDGESGILIFRRIIESRGKIGPARKRTRKNVRE